MNIIELEVILHHFYKPYPIEQPTLPERDAEKRLLKDGMIEPDLKVMMDHVYRVTERGRVFINALKNVPLPVQAWVNPTPTKET